MMATMRKSNLPDRITRDLHINTKFEDEAPPAAPAPAAEAPAPAPAPPAAEAPPATPLAPAEAPPAAMESTNNNIPSSSIWKRIMIALWQLVQAYDFPILLLAFIGIAKAAPKFGAFDLAPQYTATWIAVALIFFLSGMGLKCEQVKQVLKHYRFHLFVQVFNFGFASAVVYEVSRILKSNKLLSNVLCDGLTICGCLPMAINAVTVLTAACHGDEAASIFNEALGNMAGVFLSPLLIRGYLGANEQHASLPTIFWKLVVRVIVPLILGQALRMSSSKVAAFRQTYTNCFARAQKYLLIFIVYTIFCQTFQSKTGISVGQTLAVMLVIFLLQLFLLACAWLSGHLLFRHQPRLRVVALFGGVAKTIALGIPLIQSLYEHNDHVGAYALPVLIWYPMLLVIGSCLTPFVAKYVDHEVERVEQENEYRGRSAPSVVNVENGMVVHEGNGLTMARNENNSLAVVDEEQELTLAEYESEARDAATTAAADDNVKQEPEWDVTHFLSFLFVQFGIAFSW